MPRLPRRVARARPHHLPASDGGTAGLNGSCAQTPFGRFPHDAQFRDLRVSSRHRRKLGARRSRVRNQTQKEIDRARIRIGAVLTDIFGANGRRILS